MFLLKRHKIVTAQGAVRRTYGTYTRAGEMVGEAQLCTVNVSHDPERLYLPIWVTHHVTRTYHSCRCLSD